MILGKANPDRDLQSRSLVAGTNSDLCENMAILPSTVTGALSSGPGSVDLLGLTPMNDHTASPLYVYSLYTACIDHCIYLGSRIPSVFYLYIADFPLFILFPSLLSTFTTLSKSNLILNTEEEQTTNPVIHG